MVQATYVFFRQFLISAALANAKRAIVRFKGKFRQVSLRVRNLTEAFPQKLLDEISDIARETLINQSLKELTYKNGPKSTLV